MEPEPIDFETERGLVLMGDALGPEHGPLILLLHGGGQTRQSWAETQVQLAARGFRALALDQRGHGEASWSKSGAYGLESYAADIAAVARLIGTPPVALVGASLGGMASMLALGEKMLPGTPALVLVDVVHRPEAEGASHIRTFMSSASDGFDNLEAAADAVAAYLPHRERPRRLDGLRRNLREREGRWYWHWDPAFMRYRDADTGTRFDLERVAAAAARLEGPVMLVRGERSEIVSEDLAREFQALVPHADLAVVPGASHMVSGDSNDAFVAAIMKFLRKA
ncbi:alpha/beta fold hydrolase [Sphingopyxis sp.]|uniref:alpha/beta fold hydrolase n=1 Tax=Sphingopyxis sp. TaxID=1908224 RepID=UPI003D6D0AC3